MKSPRIRIEDVAKLAGVSPTAVSFAFNNPHRLNAQTVTRILGVARQLGYAPNPHARALLAKSVGVIGVLTPQSLPSIFANPFFAAFYEGIGRICEENCLSLLTISPVAGSLSEAIAKAPVDGLIIVGLHETHPGIDLLHRRQMPFVIVDGDALNAPSVNVDDEQGAWQAADFLLQRGHTDILCMTFEVDYEDSHTTIYGVGRRRLNGYKRAFADHHVAWNDDNLVATPASAHISAETFRAFWDTRPHPTAVLAVADVIAIGVLSAAADLDIDVPGSLAVIGYDDIPQAMWTQPTLTTVRQPVVEKGELAAQQLLALISGDGDIETNLLLPTELIVRQSTR